MLYRTILILALISLAATSSAMLEQKTKAESEILIAQNASEQITVTVRQGNALCLALVNRDGTPGPEAEPCTRRIDDSLAEIIVSESPQRIKDLIAQINDKKLYDKDFKKRLLITGETGVGKTNLGMAIAAACNLPYLFYVSCSIPNSYLNSGLDNLDRIFSKAAALEKPCVIIIDEFYFLIQIHNNNDPESGMLRRLLYLLNRYKDYPIFFIGNLRNDEPIPAFVRRFFSENNIVNIPLPNEQQRENILRYYIRTATEERNHVFSPDISVKLLAHKTENYNHRELEGLISRSIWNAYTDEPIGKKTIQMRHFPKKFQVFPTPKSLESNDDNFPRPLGQRLRRSTKRWAPIIGTCVCIVAVAGWAYMKHKRRKKKKATTVTPVYKQAFAR